MFYNEQTLFFLNFLISGYVSRLLRICFASYLIFHNLSICENLNQDDPITISDNCPIFEEILKLFKTIVKYKTTIGLPILELILFFILKLTQTYFSSIDIRLIHRNLCFWGYVIETIKKKRCNSIGNLLCLS